MLGEHTDNVRSVAVLTATRSDDTATICRFMRLSFAVNGTRTNCEEFRQAAGKTSRDRYCRGYCRE